MPLDNDTTQFIAAVRRDAFLAAADTQGNWTDERILAIADDCTLAYCAPALKRAKQGWFQDDVLIAMTARVSKYDVPEEAMWSGIERAWLVDSVTGQYASALDVVASSNRMLYQAFNTPGGAIPTSIYLSATQLVVSPPPSVAAAAKYRIMVSAYLRPSQLCLPSVTCRVLSANSVTQVLTTTTQPSTWPVLAIDTFTSGSPYRIDVYNRLLPNTRKYWNLTMTVPSVTALAFAPTVTAAQFATIAVGDFLVPKGTTPFPDLPPDAVPFLRKMVQKTILTAQTDTEALQAYLQSQAMELEMFMKGMSNRSDGSPRKLSLANSAMRSFVRMGPSYRR